MEHRIVSSTTSLLISVLFEAVYSVHFIDFFVADKLVVDSIITTYAELIEL